jgi:hypothetical protein
MIMPDEDAVGRIFEKLDTLQGHMVAVQTRQEMMQEVLNEQRADMKSLVSNGCAKAVYHADHESRIRSLESRGNVGMALSGGVGTGIGAAITALLNWMANRG